MIKILIFLGSYFFSMALANADTPNAFNITKMSAEALTAGMEGCIDGFKKGRIQQGRWSDTIEDEVLATYTCSCQLDAMRGNVKMTAKENQKCIDYASLFMADGVKGKKSSFINQFKSDDYTSVAIQGAFSHCEKTEKLRKDRNWPKKYGQIAGYCSCTVDWLVEQKSPNLLQYFDTQLTFNKDVEKKCLKIAKERKAL